MNPKCPFCNITMYRVQDIDYPKLPIYQCYECGFTVDDVLLHQKGLFNAWERLFYVAKPKGIIKPKLLPKWDSDGEVTESDREYLTYKLFTWVSQFGFNLIITFMGKH